MERTLRAVLALGNDSEQLARYYGEKTKQTTTRSAEQIKHNCHPRQRPSKQKGVRIYLEPFPVWDLPPDQVAEEGSCDHAEGKELHYFKRTRRHVPRAGKEAGFPPREVPALMWPGKVFET